MKMFKKRILAALALIACMQHAHGNIFTNIIKTLVGYGAARVDQGIAYVDQLWFNVEQDLYKPMEQANVLYDALQKKQQHIALQGNDAGFPENITHPDEAEKAVKNLLYLLEQKKVAFADAKKSLHCFKTGAYSTAEVIADDIDMQQMVTNALIEVQAIENILKPVLQKSYARNRNNRTLIDVIRGNEHDVTFVQNKINDIKGFLWSQVCDNKANIVNQLMNSETQDAAIDKLFADLNVEIAQEKDAAKREALIKAYKTTVQYTQKVCSAFDLYAHVNKMIQFLTKLQSPLITSPLIQATCTKYHDMIVVHDTISEAKQKINADSLVLFVKNNTQCTIETLTNRSVVVAKDMQEALVNGQVVDTTVSNTKLFATNQTLVKNSILRLVTAAFIDVDKMKSAFEKLDYIGVEKVVMPRLGNKTVAAHFKAHAFTKNDEYTDFGNDLATLVQRVLLNKNTPTVLVNSYVEDIKRYAELVRLEDTLKIVHRMSNGTNTVTQIDKLLKRDKQITTAYAQVKKQKALFDKNQAVSKLQLQSDDINLDTLLSDRGATFSTLRQRLGVGQSSSWEAASTIVTAGEDAYAAYIDLIKSCKQMVHFSDKFDFDVLLNRSLGKHTHAIVSKTVAANKGNKEAVLADLNELQQVFVTVVNKGNYTDQTRIIITEIADLYINSIKSALKAQVIAAWYTHDIAWKMENKTVKGSKGSLLDGLRKLTPTCGKSVSLKVIS